MASWAHCSIALRCALSTWTENSSRAMPRSACVLVAPMTHPGPSSCLMARLMCSFPVSRSTSLHRDPEEFASTSSRRGCDGDGSGEDWLSPVHGRGDEPLDHVGTP